MKTAATNVKRILVIEDEPAISELCRRVLTGEGFEVDIAVNGKVAQDIITKNQYQIFLMDIKMPILGGKELYRWLQEKHPQLASRVIFTTGSAIGQDTNTFIEKTGRPCLHKPFTPDQLNAIVSETLKEVAK